MKKTMFLSILIITLITLIINYFLSKSPLNLIKSGKAELVCIMKDGERKIPSEMIKFEQDGYWGFVNGGASNCYVKEIK